MIDPAQKTSINRTYLVLQVMVFLIFMVFFGRLIQLQILDHDIYNPISERNSIRQEVINPARGLVYDRHGNLIISNEPTFTITITPLNFDRSTIPLLAELTQTDEETIERAVTAARSFSLHRASRLLQDVSFEVFSNVQENLWRLPGIDHLVEGKRSYPSGARFSHTLGYLSEVTRAELEASGDYRLGDQIGRMGIERRYESDLRGTSGTRFITVNALGRTLGSFDNGNLDIFPEKGSDLHTTLDVELQKLAEKLLVGKTGGVVALDPRTGGILAIASAPDYDNSRLAGRIDRDYWVQISSDSLTPLFNRSIATVQPPGSTLKPLTGLMGLQMGIITPQTTIYCPGGYQRGRFYRCLRQHGNQTIEDAIETSCNTFFYALMDRMMSRHGLNLWAEMKKSTGLGRRNNIDLTGENAGLIPDSTYFNRVFGERRWGLGDLISLGIGQGAMGASPLQMAVSTASIANGGYLVQPHLVHTVVHPDGKVEHISPSIERINWIRNDHLMTIQRGMRRAVLYGGGRFYANLPDVSVAGKTGTAQNPHGQNHGWYIAYAPAEDPQIVIAVLLEGAGFGSVSASPIAGLMFEQYFYGEIRRQRVLDHVLNFVPEPYRPD